MYMYNSSMHIDQSIEDSNAVQPVSSIATFCSVAPSLLELRSLTPCSIKTSAILQYVYTTSIRSRFTGSSKNIYVDPIETQTVWRKGARCVLSDGCCVARPQRHGNSVNINGRAVSTMEDRTILTSVSRRSTIGACMILERLNSRTGRTNVAATKGS